MPARIRPAWSSRPRRGSFPVPRAPSRPAGSSWGLSDPVCDHLAEAFALILLKEMSRAFDRRVRLPSGARHPSQEQLIGAAGDRVAVAERAQPRTLERLEHAPRRDVLG